ncbi:MAG: hypothetical protein ACJ71E_13340 [Nitrososphaeraceae archaeon]
MANPILDLLELSPDGIVTLGEKVSLLVDAEQFFEPDVTVAFRAFFTDDAGADKEITFRETLVAEPVQPTPPGATLKRSRIAWPANLGKGKNKDAERHSCTVIFTVNGVGVDGRRIVAKSLNKIIIRPILITKDPRLTRIMVHEFSKPKTNPDPADDDPFEFDPAPLQAHIDGMSPEQKKLLLNTKVAKPAGRLVVLITLYAKKPELRMRADFSGDTACARPNATFSVFHCQGPEKDVTLVCHTEHFLLNLNFGPCNTWLHAPQSGKPASEWLKKSNTTPPKFRIGSMLPQDMCDGVIWSRIFTADGADIMPGNTMHGVINTKGCWMLFRNYNWPADKLATFDRIFRKIHRVQKSDKPTIDALAAPDVGYDVRDRDPQGQRSTSFFKFIAFDRNSAYIWFFHDVVGIKYFADSWQFLPKIRFVNEFRTHGKIFASTFPRSKIDDAPKFNTPEEGTLAYHDNVQRRADDAEAARKLSPADRRNFKPFVVDDTLWGQNALGFKAADGFIPQRNGLFANLPKADAERFTWADLYVYKEDNVDIVRLTANYAEPGD